MKLSSLFRLLLIATLTLSLAAALLVLFHLTGLTLQVWDFLRQAPPVFIGTYVALVLALASLVAWLGWRLLGRASPRKHRTLPPVPPPRTEAEMRERIEQAEAKGVDVAAARHEVQDLQRRRETGKVYIALFGEVSTGKSSLIKAFLPACEVAIDPRGGTTRQLTRHTWTSPSGDSIVLVDMPGLNEPGGLLDELSREETRRAHVVLYLVDGDLTRAQHQELQQVLAVGKPVILVLNKMDQYRTEELSALRNRLQARVGEQYDLAVVTVSAGRQREVIKVHPDGREERVAQEFPPRLDELVQALMERLRQDPAKLEALRETAVVRLAGHKLDESLAAHRHKQSRELISQYTKKAVIGAMAAVSPGTDLIVQGYLGVGLIKDLCELYEVPVREMDISAFLKLASKNVIKTLPILLTVAGNAMKAFPGVGTLAGGLLHAVGYGLIFESLGRAVATSLARHGALEAPSTLRLFDEDLRDDLEARARRLTRLALDQGRGQKAARHSR